MKTMLLVTASVMLLASTIVSPSTAGSWVTIERPCGSKCAAPQPTQTPMVGMPFRRTGDGGAGNPTYVSRSRSVIRSNYGTTVIRGTYRSYSR